MTVIRGTTASEELRTDNNGATVFADEGNDTVFGEGGHDELRGGEGDDLLRGSTGNDTLNGGEGNDTLNGGADDDILRGGLGDDKLSGSVGDDIMNGGMGNDVLNGGDGADRFYFQAGTGSDRDRINDFSTEDLLVLEDPLSVTSIATINGDDALILLSSGDEILLRDVDADALQISPGGDVIFL